MFNFFYNQVIEKLSTVEIESTADSSRCFRRREKSCQEQTHLPLNFYFLSDNTHCHNFTWQYTIEDPPDNVEKLALDYSSSELVITIPKLISATDNDSVGNKSCESITQK